MGEYHKQKGHGRISLAKRSWVNITSKKVMGEYHKQKGHGRISQAKRSWENIPSKKVMGEYPDKWVMGENLHSRWVMGQFIK